jgi:hypothetical protein
MTANTVIQVGDPFMFLLYLIFVVLMAGIASVTVVIIAGVAAAAIAASTTVIERKGMTEIGRQPAGCVVAEGALAWKMIGWFVWQMAALAVNCTGNNMVEGCWKPGRGLMTS